MIALGRSPPNSRASAADILPVNVDPVGHDVGEQRRRSAIACHRLIQNRFAVVDDQQNRADRQRNFNRCGRKLWVEQAAAVGFEQLHEERRNRLHKSRLQHKNADLIESASRHQFAMHRYQMLCQLAQA